MKGILYKFEQKRKMYEKIYPVEKEITKEKIVINIPEFLIPSIANTNLIPKINEKNKEIKIGKNIKYTNGAIYNKSKCLLKMKNGEEFSGIINNNTLIKGKYKWPNGQIYIGKFNNNNFNTEDENGCITFKNGNTLSGTFKDGILNDVIEFIKKEDNTIITGNFENGKNNGDWSIINESKNFMFKGKIKNEKIEGNFHLEKMYDKKLLSIDGIIINSKKEGEFFITEIYPIQDNFIINGIYKNDKRNGHFLIQDKENNILIEDDFPYKFQEMKKMNDYKNNLIYNYFKKNFFYKKIIVKPLVYDSPQKLYLKTALKYRQAIPISLQSRNLKNLKNFDKNTLKINKSQSMTNFYKANNFTESNCESKNKNYLKKSSLQDKYKNIFSDKKDNNDSILNLKYNEKINSNKFNFKYISASKEKNFNKRNLVSLPFIKKIDFCFKTKDKINSFCS